MLRGKYTIYATRAKEIDDYISSIKEDLKHDIIVGAIVMNCNPFTLGHKYLIEKAIAKVDYLYIFIVEEDKSFFHFSDRLQLVKDGVSDIKGRIKVVPSGKFIISGTTFKDYFSKESNQKIINPSNDVMIFGAMIAPHLNVSYRFLGEEPSCQVTSQYNASLAKLLPELGINVEIIPRLQQNGLAISASRVRKLLSEKNFIDLSPLVPKSTFDYLFANQASLISRLEMQFDKP